jgi:uncharacterized membrane protein
MHSWSRGDKIALWSLIVAIVSCAVTIRSMPRSDASVDTSYLRSTLYTDTSTAAATEDTMTAAVVDSTWLADTTAALVIDSITVTEDTTPTYYTLGLKNSCADTIYVALNHRDEFGRWRTRGWWKVEPGATMVPDGVRSYNSFFYIYAETGAQQVYWDGSKSEGSITRNVPQHAFEHRDDLPTQYAQSRLLSFFPRQISGAPREDTQEFTC